MAKHVFKINVDDLDESMDAAYIFFTTYRKNRALMLSRIIEEWKIQNPGRLESKEFIQSVFNNSEFISSKTMCKVEEKNENNYGHNKTKKNEILDVKKIDIEEINNEQSQGEQEKEHSEEVEELNLDENMLINGLGGLLDF